MRQGAVVVISFWLGFSPLSVSTAEEALPESAPIKGKITYIKGEVTAVDPESRVVKIKERDREVVFDVPGQTIMTAGRERRSLADLKTGDKVVVGMTEKEGKLTARSIRMATAARKAPAPTSPPPASEDKTLIEGEGR
ncbi:MAG TPA: hypothetical protein VI382_09025 [Candidatus Manganitrophaceae bacterium]|nr:hypothetical protein [Candidatus Manganitrophaceae bacterium]